MRTVVEVFNLSYSVESKVIVDHVSFVICEGDVFALLGKNGAGKSTLMNLMLNDLKPNSGYAKLLGNQNYSFKNIGIVYDHLPLFPLLKVFEIIRYFSAIHRVNFDEIKKKYFELFEIDEIENNFIKSLSQGERKRVSLLLSIIHNPSLLLLDEPFANLDPTVIDRVWRVLKQSGRTIFLTTHNWVDAERMATKVGFMYNGKLLFDPIHPKQIIKNLPSDKKIIMHNAPSIRDKFKNLPFYIHDEKLHVFYNDDEGVLNHLSEMTTNFTIASISLKDAYLFYVYNN